MRFIACAALLAGALVATAGSARAQDTTYVERRTEGGQDVRFRDDPMSALTDSPVGAQLSTFRPPRRFDLMRPRWNFVPQLLQSVEHL